MIVVGMDPSMSNWGLVKADLQGRTLRPIAADVVTTKKLSKKKAKHLYKNQEDLERAMLLSKGITEFIGIDTEHIYVELPVGSKSSRAMASYGICIGVFAQVRLPFTIIRNTEIKKFVGYGDSDIRKVEKEEVIKKMLELGYEKIFTGFKKNVHEHIADAMAALYIGSMK